MKYVRNDAMIRLRAYADCSSLGAWPTAVTVLKARLAKNRAMISDETLKLHATALCAWHYCCKARVASKCRVIESEFVVTCNVTVHLMP